MTPGPTTWCWPKGLARYEEFVTEPVTRLESSWAGLRTFAPDRSLVLGPDADDPSFVWVAGQGGYGFQTSPAASQLVADLVAGRQPELAPDIVARLSPRRFQRGLGLRAIGIRRRSSALYSAGG